MTGETQEADRFWSLLDAACAGTLVESHAEELAALLDSDPAVRSLFIDHVQLRRDIQAVCRAEGVCDRALSRIGATVPQMPLPGDLSSISSVSTSFSPSLDGAIGYFSSAWPVAYLIATVIFAVGLIVGGLVPVSHPVQVTKSSPPNARSVGFPTAESVGRITGMSGCRWIGADGVAREVALGSTYRLKSGLVEITYNTGAKVILQGPAAYEVDSPSGGYLSLGKLTARLEQKSEVRGQTSEAASQKSGIRNSLTSDLCPLTSGLFAVRTPTAIVTDLGTEFAVEVDKKGDTTSHVFRGLVQVQGLNSRGRADGIERTLRENESVRVERCGGDVVLAAPRNSKDMHYARAIPDTAAKKTIKIFDLVDVVAGGDGFSGKRNKGIDPLTGQVVQALDRDAKTPWTSDGQYHRVAGNPFIDGVFVPNGGKNAVQVDSAGNVCGAFRESANSVWQYIWAGGHADEGVPTQIGGVDYASEGHGLLYFNGTSAITFNLEAIRRANTGRKLLRFCAVAANVGTDGPDWYTDVIVLVDGKPRFQRWRFNNTKDRGEFSIIVPIYDKDRFLTLAATDGGDGVHDDWIIFGDPRLDLLVVDSPDLKKQENGDVR